MANRSQGVLIGCLVVFGVAAAAAVFFLLTLGAAGVLGPLPYPLASRGVGVVEINGTIGDARFLVDEIEAHRRDSTVRAVVVRVNSPGGEVAPSQELHLAVRRLAEEKPVVASLGSVAASGGYYAIAGADRIVANAGTLTGSIGVIFEFPTASELMDKIGLRYWTYKSGELKDMGSFSREPTEAEENVLDGIISDVYEQFLEAVMEGREMTREEALAVADGRIYSGRQAAEAGLVDEVGDFHRAIDVAAEMAGISGAPRLIYKSRPRSLLLDLIERMVGEVRLPDGSGGLRYRWR